MTKYLIPLLLIGCSTGPTLEDQHRACGLSRTPECIEIAKEMDRKAQREKERGPKCPRDMVEVKNFGELTCQPRDQVMRELSRALGR